MSQLPGVGSRRQSPDAPERKLRPVANVQLIAVVTLALSTLIAATAVSIGLARAEIRCNLVAQATEQHSVLQPHR
jgi:hypothetical protein